MKKIIAETVSENVFNKNFIRLFFMVCLMMVSCSKRYEEGPCLSFITPENRIAGSWKLEKYLVNGADLLIGENDEICPEYNFSFFRNNNNSLFVSLLYQGKVIAESLVRTDERMLYLSFGLKSVEGYESLFLRLGSLLPALAGEHQWKIIKLKRREMGLETTHEGSLHKVYFRLLIDYN